MSDETPNDTGTEDLVIPPGGPRPSARVHPVGPGEAVRIDEEGAAAIVPRQPADLGRVDEMVRIPGGYRHRSLVHLIERGNRLECQGGGHHREVDPAGRVVADYGVLPTRPSGQPLMPANVHVPAELAGASGALSTGWITDAAWKNTAEHSISRLQATWRVPCAPRRGVGQLVYLFPGLQNSSMILQPVLQWGVSGAGGGDYWAVASWYVDGRDGHAFVSHPLVRVEVGDTLVGAIATVDEVPLDNPYWFPGAVTGTALFDGIDHTTLLVQHVPGFDFAAVTLEAYGLASCSDYPDTNKTRFWNIVLETGADRPALTWTPQNRVTDCGQFTEVGSSSVSDGEVTLWYRPQNRFPAGTQVGVASPSEDRLDLVVLDSDGQVDHAAWEPDSDWQGWWRVVCGAGASGGPIDVVSRSADKLDAFSVGTDDHVLTAAWEPDTGWRGWWRIGEISCSSRAPVHAVSRSRDKLDVFVAGDDGHVWTAAWEPDISGWRGWWQIGDLSIPPGAPVHAVSRSRDKLDVFAAGDDGHVWTAAWEPNGSGWRGWWQIGDLSVPPGATVHAVSRSRDKLDIFVVGKDFHVWTAFWEPDITGWQDWSRIGDISVAAGSPVHAVSRSRDKLDVFVTDAAGIIRTASWAPAGEALHGEPDIPGWRGWSDINGGKAPARAPVTAVSRSRDRMDIFVVDEDAIRTASWDPDAGWSDWRWPAFDS